jgi:ABC-type nitrate/sulfonate/bicarbonate transport system permease component
MRLALLRAGFLIALVAVWELVARPLDPVLYVAPSTLPQAVGRLLSQPDIPPLLEHLGVTLRAILTAYALAVATGLGLGFVMGFWRVVARAYEPILAALYAVPSVVWYPSLMLLFGLGPASKVAFGFLLGFFPIVLAVLAGIKQADPHLLTVATSMGASRWAIYWKVLLPGMAGTLASGLRSGLALCVVGVLAGELLGSRAGIGYVINHVYNLLKTPEYVALAVIMAAIVLVIDAAAGRAEARVKRWAG